MTNQLKLSLAVAAAAVLVIGALLAVSAFTSPDNSARAASAPPTDRGDGSDAASRPPGAGEVQVRTKESRVLGEPTGSGVELVEFLDFECEGCGAFYPVMEDLREKYKGEITFVVRYFPLPNHVNSERAARAAEAAGLQGKFEEMYSKLFTTQKEWGEQKKPLDDLFLAYAEDIDLDLVTFERDYNSTSTEARVGRDVLDGQALGLTGTPSFFLNGEPLRPESYDDLTDALDGAIDAADAR